MVPTQENPLKNIFIVGLIKSQKFTLFVFPLLLLLLLLIFKLTLFLN
jgi:hypothetical protein